MSRFASCGMICTALLAFAAIGCGSDDEKTATKPERVEFLTFWREGGELEALDKLVEIHSARRPNAEIIKTFEANATYQMRLTERMADQNPPDTFQSNMGQRLLKWVTDSQVALEEVQRGDWNMPDPLLQVNSRNEKLYAVPISLIRQSSFYYSKKVFADHDVDIDALMQPGKAGVDALLATCAQLKADGVEEPFALGNVYNWTLDMMFWESLFPAVVGHEYYTKFWMGDADPENDPELDEALSYLLDLSQYFNTDSGDVDFPDVLERVALGTQAFGQQGDWGTGVLTGMTDGNGDNKGYAPGDQFDVMPFPGTSDLFIFSQDVLPIVAGTPNRAATQELLNTIATEELQVEFNKIKGSLPALTGITIEDTELTDVQKATYAQFNDENVVKIPVVHGFKPDDVMADLSTIEKTMIETQDTEELKNYIVANYQLLKK